MAARQVCASVAPICAVGLAISRSSEAGREKGRAHLEGAFKRKKEEGEGMAPSSLQLSLRRGIGETHQP